MPVHRTWLCIAALIALNLVAHAAPFAVFPKTGHLSSPDGRFVVRNTERTADPSGYVGTFHSLFLEDTAGGHSRKLCDYVGVAAVAWAKDDFLIVTEYVNKRTSRALIFAADDSRDTVVIDQPLLTHLVPVNLRPQLRENDHVFVEASQAQGDTLTSASGDTGNTTSMAFAGAATTTCSQARFPARNTLLGRQLIPAISFVSR